MTRSFYQFILWMHPPAFRRRFRDEMLSIFDEGGARHLGFALLLDGLSSFARQWLLRTDSWKILIAVSGAFIQVLPVSRGHQDWAKPAGTHAVHAGNDPPYASCHLQLVHHDHVVDLMDHAFPASPVR
jgi:hypothetical protein